MFYRKDGNAETFEEGKKCTSRKLVQTLDETAHYPVKKMCKPSEKARESPNLPKS